MISKTIRNFAVVCSLALLSVVSASAQSNSPAATANQGQAPAPKLNPQEQADYKTFFQTPDSDVDKKIQLGTAFTQKYPMSAYLVSVYDSLVQLYYAKQDWTNFYATGDKALALNPDDVNTLVIVGWVIPHNYNPSDSDAEAKLARAEKYEKQALGLLGSMAKPANLSDADFATMKAQATAQAHSGLGLVYFRRSNAADAVTELQQATSNNPMPDPSDLYVLGVELQQLKRNSEAADAFQKCSVITGPLQERCKESADQAKKQPGAGR